jgi:hypothetical protein
MTKPDPIQPEQPRREFKHYSGNSLNTSLTARTWHIVIFADDEEVDTEARKWLRQQSKDVCAAVFDGLVKQWKSVSMLVEDK